MKSPALKQALSAKWLSVALGLGLLFLLLLLHQAFPGSFWTKSIPIPKSSDSIQNANSGVIPNIVHFVHLVEQSPDATFEFPFRQFVAIYSAWYYLRPEKLYIHTNLEEPLIMDALEKTESPYTKAVVRLPGVTFRHATPPDHTTSGLAIDKLPNQSDFVRTVVLGEMGGIYLDDDSYTLRDLKPLRNIGFENIIGQQLNGQICPAVIMSKPGNKLMEAYHTLQNSVFNPARWALHATDLLTTLALDFQLPDNQVLILPQDAFFPLNWRGDELTAIYQVHEDPGLSPANNKDSQNLEEYVKDFQLYGPKTWQKDWRASYTLHGWTSGIRGELNDEQRAAMFGKFGDITLEYVLARNSNFALAVYPAVKHALDNGVLDGAKDRSSQP